MKRINRILFAGALSLIILIFGLNPVSAEGVTVSLSLNEEDFLEADTIHFGGTVIATASLSTPVENASAVFDFGCEEVSVIENFNVQNGVSIATAEHLYDDSGEILIVVIAVMPDGEKVSADTDLNVLTAEETIDWLIENVNNLIHKDGLNANQGQSLVDQLDSAQTALGDGDTETAVAELEGYLDELEGYIDAELVPKEDPGKTVADDMTSVLLAE